MAFLGFKKLPWRKGGLIVSAYLITIVALQFGDVLHFSFPLLTIILVSILAQRSTVLIYSFSLGLFQEMASPFPVLTVFIATVAVALGVRTISREIISPRTLYGAMALSSIGVLIFEVMLLIVAYLLSSLKNGWLPVITMLYLQFVLWRILETAIATTLIIFMLQRISPRGRGITMGPIVCT